MVGGHKRKIMPNYILNKLTFYPDFPEDQEQIDRIKSIILNEQGELDFEMIIPSPKDLPNPESEREKRKLRKEGITTSEEWKLNNWGTDKNAVSFKVLSDCASWYVITFTTSWKAPLPIVTKLTQLCSFLDSIDYTAVGPIAEVCLHQHWHRSDNIITNEDFKMNPSFSRALFHALSNH